MATFRDMDAGMGVVAGRVEVALFQRSVIRRALCKGGRVFYQGG